VFFRILLEIVRKFLERMDFLAGKIVGTKGNFVGLQGSQGIDMTRENSPASISRSVTPHLQKTGTPAPACRFEKN